MGKRTSMRSITFVCDGRTLPDGSVELEIPAALKDPSDGWMDHFFELVTQESDTYRRLHAKRLLLRQYGRALLCIGSSNFTGAGLGLGTGPTNVEANIAYYFSSCFTQQAKLALKACPPSRRIDLEVDEVRFVSPGLLQTPEEEGYVALPEAFGEAILQSGRVDDIAGITDPPRLLLYVHAESAPPEAFMVFTEAGEEVLLWNAWIKAGRPFPSECTCGGATHPSWLEVHWPSPEGPRRAIWPVNIASPDALPPPLDLQGLSLETLLKVLSSALPIHQAWAHATREKKSYPKRKPGDSPPPPIDSRNHLLQRMRRVGKAIDGLVVRLERGAPTIGALDWRLRGPLGVVALAHQLAEVEKEGGAFMIAEVLLALKRTDWSATENAIGKKVVRERLAIVVKELRKLVRNYPAPRSLQRYIKRVMKEVS
jgi:hypothetical protein